MSDINKFTTKEVLNKVLLDSSGNSVAANSHTSQEALNAVLDTSNNRLNVSLGGSNTISGDVTITGDLTVNGSATNSYDEIVNGDLHVKSDSGNSTTGFLVEKNDGTDVFIVDTSNSRVGVGIAPTVGLDISSPSGDVQARLFRNANVKTSLTFKNSLQEWEIGNSVGDNNKFTIRDITDSRNAFVIDGSGDTSFSGTATVSGGVLTLGTADSTSGHINAFENMSFNIDTDNDDTTRFFEFSINGSSGAGTELMRLTEAGVLSLKSGRLRLSDNETDSTNKESHIISSQYDTDESEGYMVMRIASNSADNHISIGGGHADINASTLIRFFTASNKTERAGTERMRIDSAGNVGIGVTPETSNATITTLQIGGLAAISASASQAAGSSTWLGNNVYINSSGQQAHIVTDEASVYRQVGGTHNFQTVASGSADAAISFTTNMVLDINSRISLSNNDGGSNNTTFGYHAGFSLTTNGDENTFIGHSAGVQVNTGEHNVAVGHKSIFDFKEGSYNTAVGSFALGGSHGSTADASAENVAIGYSTMGNNFNNSATTDQCVAIGAFAMNGALNNADGSVSVGYKSLNGLTSGAGNIALGFEALKTVAGGNYNTALGFEAGENLTQSENTLIGYNAGKSIVSSSRTVLIGAFAGDGINVGDSSSDGSVGVGYASLGALTSGSENCAIGFQSLKSITTGGYNTALGHNSLSGLVGGSFNTALGRNALTALGNNETNNIGIGVNAMGACDEGSGSGNQIDNNIAIGVETLTGADFGSTGSRVLNANIAIGGDALNSTGTNSQTGTIAIGFGSLTALTSGASNVAVGYQSAKGITTGAENVVLGFEALFTADGGESDNVVIGKHAGYYIDNDSADENIIIGKGAGQGGSGDLSSCIVIGANALDATGSNNLTGTIAIGHEALTNNVNGARNTVVGYQGMLDSTGAGDNVAIGYEVLKEGSTSEQNTAVGTYALGSNAAAALTGNANVAVGYKALYVQQGTAAANTMVGYQAGDGITTGSQNTGIGSDVAFDVDADNQTCVGFQATTDSANDIAIGNTSVDEIKGQVDFSTFSDKRIKKDVVNNDLGLDFINLLKPRKFKKVNPNEYPDDIRKPLDGKDKNGNKFEWTDAQANKVWDGLIAQEVKEAIDKCGTTFSGWNEEKNSKQLLTYSTMVMPLIKAVQELSAKVEELEAKLK
jgi:hypothetical protein